MNSSLQDPRSGKTKIKERDNVSKTHNRILDLYPDTEKKTFVGKLMFDEIQMGSLMFS